MGHGRTWVAALRRGVLWGLLSVTLLLGGCAQVVTSGSYTLPSGSTLDGDLIVTSGNITLEAGSRVAGSVLMTSGNVNAFGQIDDDIVMTSGNVTIGPAAVVQGDVAYTSGNVMTLPGARVGGQVGPSATVGVRLLSLLVAPLVVLVAVVLVLVAWGRSGSRSRVPVAQVQPPQASNTMSVQAGETTAPPGAPPAIPTGRGLPQVLALLLIGLGVILFVQQWLGVDVGHYFWPFFIIVPGLLFFVGMVLGGRSAAPLALPGAVITTLGLLLLYQNTTNHWESWAYAWALLAPTAVGVGLAIQGWWSGEQRLYRAGQRVAGIGLVIFLVGVFFFELLLNISGMAPRAVVTLAGPVLLIAAGLFLLLSSRMRQPSPPAPAAPVSPPEASDRHQPTG